MNAIHMQSRSRARACYLNSYQPLCITAAGREASRRFNIPPFVDGSIRREPDFEHDYPAITCLCRGKMFAPRLRENNLVAYITTKADFGFRERHRRLTTVFRVIEVFGSHAEGAEWYRDRRLPLPNNCMVPGNRAKPLNQSHQRSRYLDLCGDGGCGSWDERYWRKAQRWGTFVVCEKLLCDLSWEAPIIEDEDFITAYGKLPGTRNPGAHSLDDFLDFMATMGVEIELGD